MMKLFERQEIVDFRDREPAAVFEGLEFRRCYFESCTISVTADVRLRTTVRNVKILNCEERGCNPYGAVLEDVTVEGLKTNDLLQTWAAAFKHVVFRGKIGRIMFSPVVAAVLVGRATQADQRAFDEANAEYYSKVDWALDISEGEFQELDIRGIPARLIRRDPQTQAVITREKAREGRWRNLDLSKTLWPGWIDQFLKDGEQDVVLVAPKRHRRFREWLDGLKKLRDAGVAEPD